MFFSKYAVWVLEIFKLLSILVIIYIINNDSNASYKLAWIIPILIFPVFGCMFYLYCQLRFITADIEKKYNKSLHRIAPYMKQDINMVDGFEDKQFSTTVKYLNKQGFKIYQNTKVDYYDLGEHFFDQFKKDLLTAKKFIFLEYFIIGDNGMWNEILDILRKKVKDGVEIRVMYDGFGSITSLPVDYYKYLQSIGIKCQVFSPVKPVLSTHQNNRDHRKITSIDGKIGYTGGLNLSDEYINKVRRHGHWKDTAIRLEGDAVNSLTLIFTELWDVYNSKYTDCSKYIIDYKVPNDGYVMPYADNPLDKENVGEEVYMDIINSSKDYIYITTPYLMIDGEMMNALKHAVGRGVDVALVLPYISDGKGTREVATSYYMELIKSGVKIYEYMPGFVHAKMFVSDDTKAIVGTVNLDYRSLYLHFENAVLLYKCNCIKMIKSDIDDTITKSNLITESNFKKIPFLKRLFGRILRFIAPLM